MKYMKKNKKNNYNLKCNYMMVSKVKKNKKINLIINFKGYNLFI